MPISQTQYFQARAIAESASKVTKGGGGRIQITSTLKDRTPATPEKPLDDGQFVWGKPSSFSWGSSANNSENGPYSNSTYNFDWPDYAKPPTDPSDDPTEGEQTALDPVLYDWKEWARTETTVRINGPDGAYVDFNRIDEIIFELPNDASGRGQFVRMTFNKI